MDMSQYIISKRIRDFQLQIPTSPPMNSAPPMMNVDYVNDNDLDD